MERPGRWALAVALLGALCVWVWLPRAAGPVEPSPTSMPRADAMSVPALPIEPLSTAVAEPGAAATGHGPDEIELCAGVWVKTKPDGELDEDALNRAIHLPEVRAHLVEELRAAPDDFARAVGLWTTFAGGAAARMAMLQSVAACDTPECKAVPLSEFTSGREALARMALTTRDPRIYALAFSSCGQGASGDGACQLLSAEQWSRLDPGNAAPWLFMLDRAGRRGDAVAQPEALHRIATATRSDPYLFAVPGVILEHVPDDEATKVAALSLAVEAIGMSAALGTPTYQALFAMCSKDMLHDTNRRQSCDAAAELLVTRSNTMLDRNFGILLGQRLEWPSERTERLRGEYTAYMASEPYGVSGPLGSGCAGITADIASVRRHARIGEVGALREWVKQSGKTADDFIRIEREAQATRAAEAASAASAAPPSR